jgi:tellurite resistance protein TehA-like permease
MATSVVSVALRSDGQDRLSAILLVVAGMLWLILAAVFAERALRDRRRWRTDTRTPAALTAVAATAVLGSRLALAGWTVVAWALAAAAAALAALLLPRVLRGLGARADGSAFLIPVAVQSLATVLAAIVATTRPRWPADVALVLLVAGVACYVVVLVRFDPRAIVDGVGDQWVLGGAAAITALAAASLRLDGLAPPVTAVVAWTAWAWALLCLPVLVAGEVARPRLRYDIRRWATVFPLGMYAAAAFALDDAEGVAVARLLAGVGVWIACAAWLVVAAAAVRARFRRRARDRRVTAGGGHALRG